MTSGKELELLRVAMDLTQTALAERVGVSLTTIGRWEGQRRVDQRAVDRYLTGLATFGTIPTIEVSVAETHPADAA